MNLSMTDNGIRPAGPSDRCFYCTAPVGEHLSGCVLLTRAVVVRRTIEYLVDVPRDWDQHMIEFHRNESSHCADNDLRELLKIGELSSELGGCGCTCDSGYTEYLREATEEDLSHMCRTFPHPANLKTTT